MRRCHGAFLRRCLSPPPRVSVSLPCRTPLYTPLSLPLFTQSRHAELWRKAAERAFERLDANHDGVLRAEEILESLRGRLPAEELQAAVMEVRSPELLPLLCGSVVAMSDFVLLSAGC